jgi:ubiquitin-protein ligase
MEGSSLSPLAIRRINNELNEITENPPPNWKVIKQSETQWDIWITT